MALALLILAGCTGVERISGVAPLGGTTGQGGATGGASPAIGEWSVTLGVQVGTDLQLWTTDWIFRPDRSCRLLKITQFGASGFTDTRARDCTWTIDQLTLTVTWADDRTVLAMPFEFRASDPTRLVLQGQEYRRVGG